MDAATDVTPDVASCADGGSCVPANPCHTGIIDCSSGSPKCVDTGNPATDGTACGGSNLCCAGSCIDVQTDEKNCGNCNNTCAVTASCQTGSCAPFNIAFVTSQVFSTGNLGGRAGADAACQTAATHAGLAGTFVAYLSTTGAFDGGAAESATTLVAGARGWVRTDGMPIADKPTQLTSGSLWWPIDHDENGNRVSTNLTVMTGTDGSGAVVPGETCGDWTQTSGSQQHYGLLSGGTAGWENWGTQSCSTPAHLYCLQTSYTTPVTVTPAVGRKMFISAHSFNTSTGLAGADAVCAGDATAAGLSGTYLALLATDTTSAISRFDTTGTPWVRVDGIPVVATAADMATYSLIAPACLDSKGNYETYGGAISGSTSASTPGTDAQTCVNWTTSTTSVIQALLTRTDATIVPGYTNAFGDLSTWACGSLWPIICLQQ
jgi:hypothetical protein